ncbi:tail fiber assembly protein [Xenorhabdus sp. PB30.3]|uniref:tail fiber assembly protein n=1 Tax=Xenorhabdus sp. PB30.3 TaxID=2788941 RepID=UPI001E5F398A|nr:tail fiber assembly protein [Xenorhabdus sp. PB30.3]MCC8381503.1 tail fiber assembly protein [Xenorhabdus sp. PB30.3]
MKVYVFKSDTRSYQTYPEPDNIDDFYVFDVNEKEIHDYEFIMSGDECKIVEKRPNKYCYWSGDSWILDKKKLQDSQIKQFEEQRNNLRQQANDAITILQYSLETALGSEKEQSLLLEWKKYIVLLSQIDLSKTSNITWPTQPK